uniref:Protein fam135b-like n=1 Tax=Tetraselmis sp. GSL018 TaxID=582737 RepID=A0A061R6Z4_9CHLO
MMGCTSTCSTAAADAHESAPEFENERLFLNTEICVVLHEFFNVDLRHQGWYAVRVRLSPEPPGVASVCRALTTGTSKASGSWRVDEQSRSYQSQLFRIRFCNEEVALGDAVCFRLSSELHQAADQAAVFMIVELLFHEIDKHRPRELPSEPALATLASQRVRVVRPASGVHEMLPLLFEGQNLCRVKLSVHSTAVALTNGLSRAGGRSGLERAPEPPPSRFVFGSGELHAGCPGAGGRGLAGFPSADGLIGLEQRLFDSDSPFADIRGLLPSLEDPSPGAASRLRSPSMNRAAKILRTPYFPPAMEKDVATGDVGARHPLVSHLSDRAPASAKLAGQLSGAGSLQARAAILHRAALKPLIESYNMLVAQLQALPMRCFLPHSLQTLRMTMLLAARQFPSAEANQESLALDAGEKLSQTSFGRGGERAPRRWLKVPSLELKSADAAKSLMMPELQQQLSADHVAREGKAISLWQAIEEGRVLGYTGGDAFLSRLPNSCLANEAAEIILEEQKQIRAGVLANWACLLWVVCHANKHVAEAGEALWEQCRRAEWAPWIIEANARRQTESEMELPSRQPAELARRKSSMNSLASCYSRAEYRQHLKKLDNLPMPRLQEDRIFSKPHHNPVLYVDESLAKNPPAGFEDAPRPPWLLPTYRSSLRPIRRIHAVVFVHGYQGTAADLRLVRDHMLAQNPKLSCLMSKGNVGQAGGLACMGERLATEVLEFLEPFHDITVRKRKVLWKLSFVGHSLGNLVIRAALTDPRLGPYLSSLWLFMSISGPHLGCLYSGNTLFDSGLRMLKTCCNVRVLHELTFSDASRMEDCFLYKLAMAEGMGLFKHVVLLSSMQDGYVPPHSARVEICLAATKDKKRGLAYRKMIGAIAGNFGNGPGQSRCLRIDVDFYQQVKQQWTSLSHIVGRVAHIDFIEADLYLQFLLWTVVLEREILS